MAKKSFVLKHHDEEIERMEEKLTELPQEMLEKVGGGCSGTTNNFPFVGTTGDI